MKVRKTRARSLRVPTLIILLFSVFMSVIVLLMSILTFQYSYQTLEERTIADTEVVVRQAARNIGQYIDNIRSVSGIIETNRDIRQYLEDPTQPQAGLLRTRFSSFLNYLPQINNGIEGIFIFDRDMQAVYAPSTMHMKTGYNVREDAWYQAIASDTSGTPHLIGTSVRTMTSGDNPWVLSVARNIFDSRGNGIIGAQLVELSYGILDDILSELNLGMHGYVFIIDSAGQMIYHPQLQLINFGLKEENVHAALRANGTPLRLADDQKLYNTASIPGTDYTIVGVTPLESIVATSQQMLILYLFLTLLMGFAGFLGAVWLARYITRPLERMDLAANAIRSGQLDTQFDGHGTVETEHMAESLSAMIETIRSLMEQSVKDEEQIRINEIRALQSQINPHFLYNTLDMIVWMSEESGNMNIRDLTMALATYFRIMLSSGRDMITVQEELGHVESYLFVQKTRFETLDYTVDAEADTLSLYMPKLLIQPLAENAIYHGIRPKGTHGTIRIHAFLENDDLCITVTDDGRGMRSQELKNIYQEKPRTPNSKGSGIALRNIRERIRLYFGDEYGLQVESTYRRGTTITMCLPALTQPQEHTHRVTELQAQTGKDTDEQEGVS